MKSAATPIRRLAGLLGLGLAIAAFSPSSALALTAFVDRDTGSDANNALDCPQANPCATVQTAISVATNAGTGNTVRVDDSGTPYDLNGVSLFFGISLIADNSVAGGTSESPTGRPILQGVGGGNVLAVGGLDNAGTLSGFTVRPNDHVGIVVSGTMTAITDNVFEDPAATGNDQGVVVGASSPTVSGNTFTGLQFGVNALGGGNPVIAANEFSGIHNGNSLEIGGGAATVTGNLIHNPGAGSAQAIRVGGSGPTATASAVFRRNRILFPAGIGLNIGDVSGPISLDGDVIAGSTLAGVLQSDSDDNGDTGITLTNVTIAADPAAVAEIQNTNAQLTLDSTIVGDGGIDNFGTATCAIGFSRGPTTVPGPSGCGGFQTTADPMFANAAGNDFHLLAGSPMIDAGNPAAPNPLSLDLDGLARAVDGTPACAGDVARRDIGADEFVAAPPTCTPPPGGGSPNPPAKKCKKPKKRAASAKKKKKCSKKKKR